MTGQARLAERTDLARGFADPQAFAGACHSSPKLRRVQRDPLLDRQTNQEGSV
jgi:hypothetical protein